MDLNALRTWGIAVGAILMTAALALALPFGAPEQNAPAAPLAALADGPPADGAYVGFVVRFQGQGPIARAQRLAARGRHAEAARAVAYELERQDALRGLCFDRFTVGAAEIVLRSCAPVAAGQRAAYQAQWLARLRDMRAVAYADTNAAVSLERAPG